MNKRTLREKTLHLHHLFGPPAISQYILYPAGKQRCYLELHLGSATLVPELLSAAVAATDSGGKHSQLKLYNSCFPVLQLHFFI